MEILSATTKSTLKSEVSVIKVALAGNPNTGKSTIFNTLTGLNQKTGNFPGVTVEKRTGKFTVLNSSGSTRIELTDLPGIYSLLPKTPDEKIAFDVLCDPSNELYPDVAIIVADATNLKRSLFLCTQIIDSGVNCILAVTMNDLAEKEGVTIDFNLLSSNLKIPVVAVNCRKETGIDQLKELVIKSASSNTQNAGQGSGDDWKSIIKNATKAKTDYAASLFLNSPEKIALLNLNESDRNKIQRVALTANANLAVETLNRYDNITDILSNAVTKSATKQTNATASIDRLVTHPIFGFGVFGLVLFVIFQSIFSIASFPMDWIEQMFAWIHSTAKSALPDSLITNLLTDGILSGISGIVVFVPQIAILFFFIGLLEDSGYMARVSFIGDRFMRKFGLSGRSIIPLMGGTACAVPSIMGARTIPGKKERLITILVTPLISCSARLPVYTLIIALLIPRQTYAYGFNVQGLLMMLLYLIGFGSAITVAWGMKKVLKTKEKSFFIMELPQYRLPRLKTIGIQVVEKVKYFLLDAGKIIIAISVILWALTSWGPGDNFQKIEEKYRTEQLTPEIETKIAAEKLENSYAGEIGKFIEPAIKPLGFNWKIGIALITSFAAREVFVGTMSTLYSSVDDGGENIGLRDKLNNEKDNAGRFVYTPAVCFSLLFFYVFALQCISTLAVVSRETGHWKWPLFQFLLMGAMAWMSSFIVYNLFK